MTSNGDFIIANFFLTQQFNLQSVKNICVKAIKHGCQFLPFYWPLELCSARPSQGLWVIQQRKLIKSMNNGIPRWNWWTISTRYWKRIELSMKPLAEKFITMNDWDTAAWDNQKTECLMETWFISRISNFSRPEAFVVFSGTVIDFSSKVLPVNHSGLRSVLQLQILLEMRQLIRRINCGRAPG